MFDPSFSSPIDPVPWGQVRSAMESGEPLPWHWYANHQEGIFEYIGMTDFSYQRWWDVLDQLSLRKDPSSMQISVLYSPTQGPRGGQTICLLKMPENTWADLSLDAYEMGLILYGSSSRDKDAILAVQKAGLLRQRHPFSSAYAYRYQKARADLLDLSNNRTGHHTAIFHSFSRLLDQYWGGYHPRYAPPFQKSRRVPNFFGSSFFNRCSEAAHRINLKKMALGVPIFMAMLPPLAHSDVFSPNDPPGDGPTVWGLPPLLLFQQAQKAQTQYDLLAEEGGLVAAFTASSKL